MSRLPLRETQNVLNLLPLADLASVWFREVVGDHQYHLFVPKKRYAFLKDGKQVKGVSFASCWFFFPAAIGLLGWAQSVGQSAMAPPNFFFWEGTIYSSEALKNKVTVFPKKIFSIENGRFIPWFGPYLPSSRSKSVFSGRKKNPRRLPGRTDPS